MLAPGARGLLSEGWRNGSKPLLRTFLRRRPGRGREDDATQEQEAEQGRDGARAKCPIPRNPGTLAEAPRNGKDS